MLRFLQGLTRLHWARPSHGDKTPPTVPGGATASASEVLAPGTLIGDYEIDKQLGAGGFGTVYLATDRHMRRRVVIKLLHNEFAKDGDSVQRFLNEAVAAGKLKHPSIVVVYTFGQLPSGQPFIVYEFLDGATLDALMASTRDARGNRAPIDLRTVAQIVIKVASALHRAHRAGIIHRDVKPANILLTQTDEDPSHPTVIDFGLAKLTDDAGPKLTKKNVVMGTPSYMAPEQLRGASPDPAFDQYALAVITWELSTGCRMWQDDDGGALVTKRRAGLRVSTNPCDVRPMLPAAFGAVIAKALSDAPAERFPSMRDFAHALARAVPSEYGADSTDLLYRYAADLMSAPADANTAGTAVPAALARTQAPTMLVPAPPADPDAIASFAFAALPPLAAPQGRDRDLHTMAAQGPAPVASPVPSEPAGDMRTVRTAAPPPPVPASPRPNLATLITTVAPAASASPPRPPEAQPPTVQLLLAAPPVTPPPQALAAQPATVQLPLAAPPITPPPQALEAQPPTVQLPLGAPHRSGVAALAALAPTAPSFGLAQAPLPMVSVVPAHSRPAITPAPQRPRRTLVAAGGALVAVLAVVMAIRVLGSDTRPSPPRAREPATADRAAPPPRYRGEAPTPTSSALAIVTEPSGAEVWLDGVSRGVAPVNLAAPIGVDVEIRAELPGHAPASERVRMSADPATVRLTLTPLADAGVDAPDAPIDARPRRRRPKADEVPAFDPDGVVGP